jgi:hypothetical protein
VEHEKLRDDQERMKAEQETIKQSIEQLNEIKNE